ncbi:transcription factor HHO3-like isoform X1 [Carex rostrata]
MGSISTQDLNLRPHAMQAIGDLMRESGEEKMNQLMKSLKEEKDKIEVFKRELPLTMQILSDAIDGLKKEMERREEERLKELTPVKSGLVEKSGIKSEKDGLSEKINWLSSAQLWVDNPSSSNTSSQDKTSPEREEKWTNSYQGKFMPFPSQWPFARGSNGERQQEEEQRLNKLSIGLPGFAQMPPPTKSGGPTGRVDLISPVTVSTGGNLGLQMPLQQQQRKARRCWSPELHRLFVSALGQLGGAQVATPKQIRDLMKVDGLTNDEVKSHLQKYRLHNRRVPNGISSSGGTRPMGLMDALLGTSSEHGTDCSQQSISQSASPKDMHQFTASGRTVSTNAGDSCEDEDVRSESYNWK